MFDTISCTAAAAAGLLTVLRSPEYENGGQRAKTSSVKSISRVPDELRDTGAEAAGLEVQQHSLQRHAAATTQAGASSLAQQEYRAWQTCVFASLSPFSPSLSLAFGRNVRMRPAQAFTLIRRQACKDQTLRDDRSVDKEIQFLFFNSVPQVFYKDVKGRKGVFWYIKSFSIHNKL